MTRSSGLAAGVLLDRYLADPRHGHPVAGFGRLAGALGERFYAPTRSAGVTFTTVSVGVPLIAAAALENRLANRPVLRLAATALGTWAVLGGTSLVLEGRGMQRDLEAGAPRGGEAGVPTEPGAGQLQGDLGAARYRLRNLCARDASGLDADDLARATVESLAENSSDAVVAPLLWGAALGLPGLVGYRAINTLDAMVGYRNAKYADFGWASARLDDLVNLVPARITGALTVAVAPVAGGSRAQTWRTWRRDAREHPSPNAGHCEAAFAGAMGVQLGGLNRYGAELEARPVMGSGRPPGVADLPTAVTLLRAVITAASVVAVSAPLVGALVRRWVRGPIRGGK